MGNESFIDGEDADVSSWCQFANHASPNVMMVMVVIILMLMLVLIMQTLKCNVEVRGRRRKWKYQHYPPRTLQDKEGMTRCCQWWFFSTREGGRAAFILCSIERH